MRLSRQLQHFSCARPPLQPGRGARVAILGAGPAGLYTADELLRCSSPPAAIDIFERGPLPYGLVRYGVSPDHPEVKLITGRFATEVLDDTAVSTYGLVNVELAHLRSHYDATFVCTGCPEARALHLPIVSASGSQRSPVLTASQVVGWYNGDFAESGRNMQLERVRNVVIVGAGNVALDIARILLQDPATLAPTDITRHALRQLERSAVHSVTVLARRDALHAAFTTQELREVSTSIPKLALHIDPQHVALTQPGQRALIEKTRSLRRFHQLLSALAERSASTAGSASGGRALRFEFCQTPTVLETGADGEAVALQTRPTRIVYRDDGTLEASEVEPDAPVRRLECDLVVSAIGYKVVTPATALAPIDAKRNCIRNDKGRIERGLYVSGWAKRGPQGIVATNKWDAAETVQTYLADAIVPDPSRMGWCPPPATSLTWPQMEVIENAEKARGQGKFASLDEMLAVLRKRSGD